jgi:hypothetical protein
LVGFQSVVVVVGVVGFVDVEAVVVEPDFFDEPWLFAVVVVVDFVEGPLVVAEDPFVDGPLVVVLVVLGELDLAFCGPASTFSARAAAATNAGSAIHLVIAPPFGTVEQGTYPGPRWDSSA